MTCTEERFYHDVRDHEMTILQDQGLHRHILFRNPRRKWAYYFELVTWPGSLMINGDMGSYAFSRERDMFEFFGLSEQHRSNLPAGKTLAINPQYWAEKITARDKNSDVEVFSSDVFAEEIKRRYVEHVRRNMIDMPEQRRDLRRQIEKLISEHGDGNEEDAMRAAYDFQWRAAYPATRAFDDARPTRYKWADFSLEDFWEVRCREYSIHYTWCLYAIVWGIWHYEQRKDYMDFWRAAA